MKTLLLCSVLIGSAFASFEPTFLYDGGHSLFLSRMNLSADPCNDFYNYACGLTNNSIYDLMMEEEELAMRHGFEDRAKPTYNGRYVNSTAMIKVVKYYNTCVKTAISDVDFNRYVKQSVDQFMARFNLPLNLFESFPFIRISARIKSEILFHAYEHFLVQPFFKLETVMEDDEAYIHLTYSRPSTFDEKEYHCDNLEKLFGMFIEAVSNMKEVMGQWKVPQESVKRIANDIMNFELGLFGVRCPEDQSIQPAQHVADITMSINELQNYTTFGIGKYVKLYLKSATRGFDIRLNNVKIRVSPDTLVNLNNFADTLSDDTFLKYIYFTSLINLLKNQPSDDCFDLMLPFPQIKSQLYWAYKLKVLSKIDGEAYQDQSQIANYHIKRFNPLLKKMLESLDGARHDNETLQWINDKFENLPYYNDINIKSYSDYLLDAYYQQLEFGQDDDFLDMHFKVLKFLQYKSDMRLRFSSSVTKDHPDYLINSDDYKALENLVHVFDFTLFAQLFPLTHLEYSSIVSLREGSVYFTIFRDIVHYLYKDLTYDHGENIVSKKAPVLAVKKFEKLARCVAGQDNELNVLSNYRNMEDVNVDHMISKILTDIGGLEVSYDFFIKKRYDKNIQRDIRMRDITEEQLFFVGFAGSFCKKQTDAEIADVLRNGGLPNEARVKVTLRNIPAFANAFKCPASSEYVAEQRCRVLANWN